MREVTRFQCDHCRKVLARKAAMEKHEKECVHNPESINCFRCRFACMDDYESFHAWDDGSDTIHNVPQCVHTDDVIRKNVADKCEFYIKSDESNVDRDYEQANNDYINYRKNEV